MNLLIVRHAIAEEREDFAKTGEDDEKRPLTADGRKKMKRAAKGLREIAPEISLLASSPLVRARETADIIAHEYGIERHVTIEALRPEASFMLLQDWLRAHQRQRLIALVGHEPHLSSLVSWFLSGRKRSQFDLKKGAACLVNFEGFPKSGEGTLEWLLAPSHLRAVARRER